MQGFREGMKDLGYQEGRNITIDYQYGGLTREISTQMSAAAVASKPDLIITQAGLAHSTNALTKTIPIVAVYSGDLVDGGSGEEPGGPCVPQSSRRAPGARRFDRRSQEARREGPAGCPGAHRPGDRMRRI